MSAVLGGEQLGLKLNKIDSINVRASCLYLAIVYFICCDVIVYILISHVGRRLIWHMTDTGSDKNYFHRYAKLPFHLINNSQLRIIFQNWPMLYLNTRMHFQKMNSSHQQNE